MLEPTPDRDVMLNQFNRLMQDLFRDRITRTCFKPWEIELLLDIESCRLRESSKRETLRRYQRMVERELEKGADTLPKLSEFLMRERGKRGRNGTADGNPVPVHPAEPFSQDRQTSVP